MKSISILALNNVLSSSVTGTADLLGQAGLTYNYIADRPAVDYFDVRIVTEDGKCITGFNGVQIAPHAGAWDIQSTDVIVISSFMDLETLDTNRHLLPWVKAHYDRGTVIAAVCAGSFFLAETGLLNGRRATTHWGFADQFKARYPEVNLRPDRLITDEAGLLCSGGCNSYIDLCVYLIERFCGKTVAMESSKAMIHDYGRGHQSPYTLLKNNKCHKDPQIEAVQAQLEARPAADFRPEETARNLGMSRRTFERRFKAGTGVTPIAYLHRVRVETGKHLLETTRMSFDEIAYKVGYDDPGFFRKVFKKYTCLLPAAYRKKFQR